jgi:hypothetical protein
MAGEITRLILAAKRTADTADALGTRFASLLGGVLRDTERHLRPIVADAAKGAPSAIVRAAQANRTREQIRAALRDSGYDELADAFTGRLDEMTKRVLAGRRIAELSADLTPRLEARLAALKALYAVDLIDEGDQVARLLWKATVRGVFGSADPSDILNNLGRILDRSEPQIATLYDTSVSIFGRQVEALQAGDDPDTKFLYVGPVDGKTRDFCLERVGQVFTRAEIDEMDNEQLGDVFLTGGGYNCRHTFMEVSKFSELHDFESGERVPEVAEELDALREAA